jgi:hypothetical protein
MRNAPTQGADLGRILCSVPSTAKAKTHQGPNGWPPPSFTCLLGGRDVDPCPAQVTDGLRALLKHKGR